MKVRLTHRRTHCTIDTLSGGDVFLHTSTLEQQCAYIVVDTDGLEWLDGSVVDGMILAVDLVSGDPVFFGTDAEVVAVECAEVELRT
jgi:hypothetical protein